MSKIYRLNENELLMDRIERNPRVKNFLEHKISYLKKPEGLPAFAKKSGVKNISNISDIKYYTGKYFLVGITIPLDNIQNFQYFNIEYCGNTILKLIYVNKKTGQLKFNRTFGLPHNQRFWLPILSYGQLNCYIKYRDQQLATFNPQNIKYHIIELSDVIHTSSYNFGPFWCKNIPQQFLLVSRHHAVLRYCSGIRYSQFRYFL
jgi:hypothetical protein